MGLGERLERSTWDLYWLPADALAVERPELLYVRCPRNLRFLNAVYRTRLSSRQIDAAVAEVGRAHAGRRSAWHLPDRGRSPALERRLANAGWTLAATHHARPRAKKERRRYRGRVGRSCGPVRRPACRGPRDRAGWPRAADACGLDVGWKLAISAAWSVECVATMGALREWHGVLAAAFGQARDLTEAELEEELATRRVVRVLARDRRNGDPVSAGGLNLFPALGLGFLWGGGTVPHARGGGAYTAVVDARVGIARAAGLRFVGMYARVETSWPVVARLGFASDGRNDTWERSPAG